MNLTMYDKIDEKVNKNKTWFEPLKRLLISRNIKYRKFYTFRKRYNKNTQTDDYFLIVSNNNMDDGGELIDDCNLTKVDDYGRLKFLVPMKVYQESILSNLKDNTNIDFSIYNSEDELEVYKLDI